MSFTAVLERLVNLENPYPGLRPFDTSEAHLFFGRDQQVLDLLDRLARNRFVAVLGLSGSGKSSLVRAGLIPALYRGRLLEPGIRWRAVIAQPVGAPFVRLGEALECAPADLRASSSGLIDHVRDRLAKHEGLLVVVDQFEELFRYKDRSVGAAPEAAGHAAQASEAAAFIQLLLASARGPLPVYVVITMRTDYLGDCAEFPDFPETLNESQYLVPRLTRQQRRQAIEGPLGVVRISSALVERILNDAGDEPDLLPILQHALMRTWSRWQEASGDTGRPISVEDYESAGGFADALNQHADELLSCAAVRAAPGVVETVFKRLTALGLGNRERRDPALLEELWALCNANSEEQRKRANAVIDVFRQGEATFLLPRTGDLKADTYIDIAHESLIRNWKVLAEKWLPAEEKQAKALIELLERARGWQAGRSELLRGLDLAGALEWDRRRNRSSRWAEHYAGPGAMEEVVTFISASRGAAEESQRLEEERRNRDLAREHQLRETAEAAARRTRTLSYVLVAFLIAASGLAVMAWTALNQRKLAESRGLAAQAEALISLGKSGEALDKAIKAFAIAPTSEAQYAIARAFPQELTKLEGHSEAVRSAAFSPDGQRVVTASGDRTARVWNAATGRLLAKLEGHSDTVNSAAFSPDGQRVVTASGDRTAWVWNASTGHVIAKLEGHSEAVRSAAFSPDGQRVVTASADRTARVWNADTGREVAKLAGHSGGVTSAAFSPDGRCVATASRDRTARVWNAGTGREVAKLAGHSDAVYAAAFSPDGQRVVTASGDRTARLWSAATGKVSAKLEGHSDVVYGAAFSPDGQRVVTASGDRTARLWNAANGQVIEELEGHSGPVISAAFSPDGQRVVTASLDRTARVWDIAATGQVIEKLEGHSGYVVYSAAFSPDGQRVVTASKDRTARVWNAATGRLLAKLEGHSNAVYRAAFSPDGQRVVTASGDRTARMWNATTGMASARLEGHSDAVMSAAFSPDGQRVVTASGDRTARVWNATTGRLVAKLEGHSDAVMSAAFSPDGQRVVTASGDRTARVWNATTGRLLAKLEGHSGRVFSAAFSPDGQRVVTASGDRTARVWNAATARLLAKLEGHSDAVNAAAFSPDGQRVVTASLDHTARVWNATTGQPMKLDYSGAVYSAAFSPDGQRVVTAESDGIAIIFKIDTLDDIARLLASTGPRKEIQASSREQPIP
jgi:WD40 repeat protein